MWERRKDTRYEIRRNVHAQVLSELPGAHSLLRLKNISSSGACFQSESSLANGTELQLEITECPSTLVSNLGFWVKLQKPEVSLFTRARVCRSGDGSKELAVEFSYPPNVLNT
jgi:hypothetical protein